MNKNITHPLKVISLALILSVGISYVSAWTAPTTQPPNGNTAAPLNVGSAAQTKTGPLNIATGAISSDTQLGSFSAPGSTAGVGYTSFGGGFVGWDYANSGIALNAHGAGGSVGGLFVQRVDNAHSNVGIGTANPQGRLDVAGDIRAGNSDIYFSNTAHNHTGIGNTMGWAAIENASNYDTLMLLGRPTYRFGPWTRSVSVWDRLDVNGSLYVNGAQVTGGGSSLATANQRNVQDPTGGYAVANIGGTNYAIPLYTYNTSIFRVNTRDITPSRSYLNTYDDFRFGPYQVCQAAGYSNTTGNYSCVQGCTSSAGSAQCEWRHNGGWSGPQPVGSGQAAYCSGDAYVAWVDCQ